MSSIRGAHMGMCMLRCGPQTGVPLLFHPRLSHSVVMSCCKSSSMSAVAGDKQWATDNSGEMKKAASCRPLKPFITDPGLVNTVSKCLQQWGDNRTAPIVMECNPGPGILTRALLDAGIKVVALESNVHFLPHLQDLQSKANGQLKVVHCDFFRLDPWSEGLVEPPSMYSSTLMKHLCINEVPWASDIPIKVFVMLNLKKERNLLWRQMFLLYEQLSIYRYGRIELNVFMSENQYEKLVSKPGDLRKYQALGVLYQAACDIQLLHKEPWPTFMKTMKSKGSGTAKSGDLPDENLCLVRITPQRNLFSEKFTPADGNTFILMVKQCLAKRKSRLIDKLNSFDPGSGEQLVESLALPKTITTGSIYPEEYKFLFEIMSRSEEFDPNFVLDDTWEDIACKSY
ncbi:dimethyladenosine transferase 2, mitochondrial [Pseudophryne corroboree]|uniref:dimethyladenosine transferase 2, mitochondrial n=1 Tax=Pseudophryne corroboree TaxID=495146 RepID=UPI003081FA61